MEFSFSNKYKLLILGGIIAVITAIGVYYPDNIFEQIVEALICTAYGIKTDLSISTPVQQEKIINTEYLEDALEFVKIIEEDGKIRIVLKIPKNEAEKEDDFKKEDPPLLPKP